METDIRGKSLTDRTPTLEEVARCAVLFFGTTMLILLVMGQALADDYQGPKYVYSAREDVGDSSIEVNFYLQQYRDSSSWLVKGLIHKWTPTSHGWFKFATITGTYNKRTQLLRAEGTRTDDGVKFRVDGGYLGGGRFRLKIGFLSLVCKQTGVVTVGQAERETPPAEVSLTGTWACDDGGTYVVTQNGNTITWTGQSADGGQTWTHQFTGTIDGGIITGDFQDVSPGRARGSGWLKLEVTDKDHMELVKTNSNFGGRRWWR